MRIKSVLFVAALSAVTFAGSNLDAKTKVHPKATHKNKIPAKCDILESSGWTASVNAFPPGKPKLGVKGAVVTKSGGYTVTLTRKAIDLNPKIVTLELTSTPPPSGHVGTAVLTTHQLKESFPNLSSRYLDKVIINCGSGTLTEISPVPTTE